MLTGRLPIVSSHGKWAAYFGGEQILASLGEDDFWRSQVVVMKMMIMMMIMMMMMMMIMMMMMMIMIMMMMMMMIMITSGGRRWS